MFFTGVLLNSMMWSIIFSIAAESSKLKTVKGDTGMKGVEEDVEEGTGLKVVEGGPGIKVLKEDTGWKAVEGDTGWD